MPEPTNFIPGDEVGEGVRCRVCHREAIHRIAGWWCTGCHRYLSLTGRARLMDTILS